MPSKVVTLGFNILIMLALASCGLVPAQTPPPTPQPIIVNVQITATFPPPTATNTPVPPVPTSTKTPRPSPTPNMTATQEYTDQVSLLQDFYDTGYISTKNWTYSKLPNYADEWAKLNWYVWNEIPKDASPDFVIRTDVSWESASNTPDDSGCGFVFRSQPSKDHYVMYISMNGYVHIARNINNDWREMGKAYYGKGSLSGQHNLTLLVKSNTFTILVDNKLVRKFTGLMGQLSDGTLNYTIISGTNAGFGTRCKFENTQFWSDPKE